jgi:flagellar hook-basal body complex protein FliE
MNIESISALAAAAAQPVPDPAMVSGADLMNNQATPVTDVAQPEGSSFDSLVSSIQSLNDRLIANTDSVHALALGQADNLHQVMMAGEQTRLAFELMLQVRGKVLDAYQELLRMQV